MARVDAGAGDPIGERVAQLIERGLERYGRGDLLGATSDWEHALALAPDSARAQECVAYVRTHFADLEASFRLIRGVPLATEEGQRLGDVLGLPAAGAVAPSPRRLSELLDDGGADLDEMVPTSREPAGEPAEALAAAGAAPLPPPPGGAATPATSAGLSDGAVPLPIAAEQSSGMLALATLAPAAAAAEPEGEPPSGGAYGDEGFDELKTEVLKRPPGVEGTRPGGDAPPPLADFPELSLDVLEDLAPLGRDTPKAALDAPPGESASPGDLDRELAELATPLPPAGALYVPHRRAAAPRPADEERDTDLRGVPRGAAPPVDDAGRDSEVQTLERAPTGRHQRLVTPGDGSPEGGGPSPDAPDPAVHLAWARACYASGDFPGAARAADRALGAAERAGAHPSEDDRDFALRAFERYVGPASQAPITAPGGRPDEALDGRLAEILERVDGARTVEQIVTASGLDRLEAYRALARLLHQGRVAVAG